MRKYFLVILIFSLEKNRYLENVFYLMDERMIEWYFYGNIYDDIYIKILIKIFGLGFWFFVIEGIFDKLLFKMFNL